MLTIGNKLQWLRKNNMRMSLRMAAYLRHCSWTIYKCQPGATFSVVLILTMWHNHPVSKLLGKKFSGKLLSWHVDTNRIYTSFHLSSWSNANLPKIPIANLTAMTPKWHHIQHLTVNNVCIVKIALLLYSCPW